MTTKTTTGHCCFVVGQNKSKNPHLSSHSGQRQRQRRPQLIGRFSTPLFLLFSCLIGVAFAPPKYTTAFSPLRQLVVATLRHSTAIMGVLQDEPNDPNTPIPRFYPIGTPGQPWTDQEDEEWKAQTKKQRSYQTEVVDKLQASFGGEDKHPHLKLVQYGALSSEYPLYAVQSKDWKDGRPCILVTGGVHGYETSGVQGAIAFLQNQHASSSSNPTSRPDGYMERINLVIAPCVSPWAYEHIQRWQADLQDPNRSFHPERSTPESQALMDYLFQTLKVPSWTCHVDLHETTNTDATEFMPAKHAKAGLAYHGETIPDGFYLVGDDQNPQLDFQTAVIESVKQVTHIAPPDEHGEIIEVPLAKEGLILVPVKQLGLCCSVTGGKYVTTTEVYPDSPLASDEICNQAQVAAITGAIDYVLLKQENEES